MEYDPKIGMEMQRDLPEHKHMLMNTSPHKSAQELTIQNK